MFFFADWFNLYIFMFDFYIPIFVWPLILQTDKT